MNRTIKKECFIRSRAQLPSLLRRSWLNANEWQEMLTLTVILLNIIDLLSSGIQCLAYRFNHNQWLTTESWFTNLDHFHSQLRSRCLLTDVSDHRFRQEMTSFTTFTWQTNRTEQNWPETTDLSNHSLTANTITAKPTNQFTRIRLLTRELQQLFTQLWK